MNPLKDWLETQGKTRADLRRAADAMCWPLTYVDINKMLRDGYSPGKSRAALIAQLTAGAVPVEAWNE